MKTCVCVFVYLHMFTDPNKMGNFVSYKNLSCNDRYKLSVLKINKTTYLYFVTNLFVCLHDNSIKKKNYIKKPKTHRMKESIEVQNKLSQLHKCIIYFIGPILLDSFLKSSDNFH